MELPTMREEVRARALTIAVATRSLRNGGTERVITQLTGVWKTAGFKVVMLTALPHEPDEFEHASDAHEVFDFEHATEESLARLMERHRFDVLVFNDGWNNRGFADNVRCLRELGSRVVCINHHAFANWAFFLNNHEDLLKDEVRDLLDALVCVNPVQALWWQRRGFRATYLQNPVALRPGAENPYRPSRTLLWVGRPLDPGKRLPLMLQLFCAVRRQLADARLIVAGQIEENLKLALLKQLDAAARGSVEFVGYVPRVEALFARAGVHVFTSVVEASPQVLCEAAAMGVPTVMFGLPCCTECTPDRGVFAVPEGNSQAFVDAVVGLAENEAQARAASERAFQWGRAAAGRDLGEPWRRLFWAAASGDAGYFEQCARSLATPDNYERLVSEVVRSEQYFVEHYFHLLGAYKKARRWALRLALKFRVQPRG